MRVRSAMAQSNRTILAVTAALPSCALSPYQEKGCQRSGTLSKFRRDTWFADSPELLLNALNQ